jgi:hypothetical protein
MAILWCAEYGTGFIGRITLGYVDPISATGSTDAWRRPSLRVMFRRCGSLRNTKANRRRHSGIVEGLRDTLC